MVTAEFITKRHFTAYELSMSGEPMCEHTEEKEKVLVASSATDKPTEMNNGKNKTRRGRVPSFISPLTGRPTTLGLGFIIFAVVFIYYLVTRAKEGSPSSGIDERAKNPKFQHILPAGDALNAAGEDLNLGRMHRPNALDGDGDDGGDDGDDGDDDDDKIQAIPNFPHQPPDPKINRPLQDQNFKQEKPDISRPKPKEFPVNVIYKPDLRCPEKPYVLFLVVCLPQKMLARTAIRRTWGKPEKIAEANGLSMSWRTIFVMGLPPNKNDQIQAESKIHGDILQGDFEDQSYEVTRKVMLGFDWAVKDIPTACPPLYVFKTSIKVYINIPLIIPWITNTLKMATDLYVGKTLREDHPIRDRNNPLFVPYPDFPGNVFPNIARGPLYMFSMNVVLKMVPKFNHITPIAMEDAYVGLLADHVGVPVKDDDHFVLIKKPSNLCHYRNMMFVFDIEPTEVMHVYKVVEEKYRYGECNDRGF